MKDDLFKGILKLKRVKDGDTVVGDVYAGWHDQMFLDVVIRVLGIDTPEIRGAERLEGLKSKKYVEDVLLPYKDFLIVQWRGLDGFGRILGYIWYPKDEGWVNLSEDLLSKNLAKKYEK